MANWNKKLLYKTEPTTAKIEMVKKVKDNLYTIHFDNGEIGRIYLNGNFKLRKGQKLNYYIEVYEYSNDQSSFNYNKIVIVRKKTSEPKALKEIDLSKDLFIDILTVAQDKDYKSNPFLVDDINTMLLEIDNKELLNVLISKKASYTPEYARIIGIYLRRGDEIEVNVSDDEKELIDRALTLIRATVKTKRKVMGWGIKYFIQPFLFRRAMIYDLNIPKILDTTDIKPWESELVDISDIWKGTSSYGTSRNAFIYHTTHLVDMDNLKDIHVSEEEIHNLFHEKNDLDKLKEILIARCEPVYKGLEFLKTKVTCS